MSFSMWPWRGPQIVTRRGVETVVLAPIVDWRWLQHAAHPGLKEILHGCWARIWQRLVPRVIDQRYGGK
ncbi:MAG TPA: type II toxin-antitoxin system prevent-host-death family antitoxin [Verrucomicrobiae bacterium]|nr:type II toxin-antitoxin system prevent-host-death family antitoxin [Verrucomicrobiae bacterium]